MEYFTKRTTAPKKGEKYYSSLCPFAGSKYDMFDKHNGKYGNCTHYAYSRFSEILGKKSNLPTCNAYLWIDRVNGYEVSKTPVIGSVIVYKHKNKKGGHVAIVEDINTKGDLLLSMSGYASFLFKTRKVTKSNGYVYSDYELLGFIKPLKEYYKVGTYKTTCVMNVRKAVGTDAKVVKTYKKGEKFTATEIIKHGTEVWGKTKDGYICIKGRKTYCI